MKHLKGYFKTTGILFSFAWSLLFFMVFASAAQSQEKTCSLFFEEDYSVENLSYHVIELKIKSTGSLQVSMQSDGKIDFYFMTEPEYQKWRKNKREVDILITKEKTTGFTNVQAPVQAGDYAAILLNTRSLIKDRKVDVKMEICTP